MTTASPATPTTTPTTALPGVERHDAAVDDVRFSVLRAGPARRRRTTPALLLHGVPETALAWRHLIPALATDRVVVAPDLKGLGDSEVVGAYDLPTLVRELAALVLHEVDGPVDVVGHDWGGTLALGLLAARPDLVRRVVVVNAPYRRVHPLRAAHIPFFALPVLPDLALGASGGRWVDAAFRLGWRAATRPDPEVLAAYRAAYAPAERRSAMLAYYRAATRPRLQRAVAGRLPLVPAPGGERLPAVPPGRHLVLWGAADPLLPVSVGEDVVRALGATTSMVTLPGVGHFPPEEAPERVAAVVGEFLRSPDPA